MARIRKEISMTEQEWKDEFAARLRRVSYQNKKYNRKQLAEASGLSVRSIERYRRGERVPDAITIAKIANALECSPEELIPVGEITE